MKFLKKALKKLLLQILEISIFYFEFLFVEIIFLIIYFLLKERFNTNQQFFYLCIGTLLGFSLSQIINNISKRRNDKKKESNNEAI